MDLKTFDQRIVKGWDISGHTECSVAHMAPGASGDLSHLGR